jgi:hypothetical protein
MKQVTNSSDRAGSDEWVTVFTGQETFFICTTLAGSTTYQIRIFGVNSQCTMGPSSPILEFRTKERKDLASKKDKIVDDNDITLIRNAARLFTIECTNDICVGDTILLTERLYAKPSPQPVSDKSVAGNKSVGSKQGGKATPGGNNERGIEGGTSVYSVRSGGLGGHLVTGIAPSHGDYIGERTLAVHVVKDNYKSVRYSCGDIQWQKRTENPSNTRSLNI